MKKITEGYGRTHELPPPITAQERATKRCQKCRNLDARTLSLGCKVGEELGTAAVCPSYDDASRQRDYFPNFIPHPDLRR